MIQIISQLLLYVNITSIVFKLATELILLIPLLPSLCYYCYSRTAVNSFSLQNSKVRTQETGDWAIRNLRTLPRDVGMDRRVATLLAKTGDGVIRIIAQINAGVEVFDFQPLRLTTHHLGTTPSSSSLTAL